MTGGGRWKPPSSDVPASERPECLATVWSRNDRTDERTMITVVGKDNQELAIRIAEELGNIRVRGHRPLKTEMTVDGTDWTYEYDSSGQVERIFRNGEVTP